jgi:hypothetical protein
MFEKLSPFKDQEAYAEWHLCRISGGLGLNLSVLTLSSGNRGAVGPTPPPSSSTAQNVILFFAA